MGFIKNLLENFNSGDKNRKQLTKLYYKFYGKALAKGFTENEAKADVYARLLLVRTKFTDYDFDRFKIHGEIYPFMRLEGNKSLTVFIEYILYLEKNRDTEIRYLIDCINLVISDLFDGENISDKKFQENIRVLRDAIDRNFAWTDLVDEQYKSKIFTLNG